MQTIAFTLSGLGKDSALPKLEAKAKVLPARVELVNKVSRTAITPDSFELITCLPVS
jgi:hypothetical protein